MSACPTPQPASVSSVEEDRSAEPHRSGVHARLTRGLVQHTMDCTARYFQAATIPPFVVHLDGFDKIDPDAFDCLSDVHVLICQRNTVEQWQCGEDYIQARTPSMLDDDDAFALASSRQREEGGDKAAAEAFDNSGGHTVLRERGLCLCNSRGESAGFHIVPRFRHHSQPQAAASETVWPARSAQWITDVARDEATQQYPLATDIPMGRRDVFSAFYSTVDTIDFSNNAATRMPDLHRFQRVRCLNYCNSVIHKVESGCPGWRAAQKAYEAAVVRAAASSAANTQPAPRTRQERRARELQTMTQYADAALHFCPHEAIPMNTAAEPFRSTREKLQEPPHPPHLRQVCSTVRILNVSGNRIRSFDDFVGVLAFKSVSVLNLSDNGIEDGEALLIVLQRMPMLLLLDSSGNPFVRTMRHYRRRVLLACPRLNVLDTIVVCEDERQSLLDGTMHSEEEEEQEEEDEASEKEERQSEGVAENTSYVGAQWRASEDCGFLSEAPPLPCDVSLGITDTAATSFDDALRTHRQQRQQQQQQQRTHCHPQDEKNAYRSWLGLSPSTALSPASERPNETRLSRARHTQAPVLNPDAVVVDFDDEEDEECSNVFTP